MVSATEAPADDFAADVRTYLTQSPRQLPSRYLYDALGSALFDAICRLPWYHVTRAETGLLERHGPHILEAIGPLSRIVELGGGNGEKLALLLSSSRPGAADVAVDLVDVSQAALDSAARTIVAQGHATVRTHQARYLTWLEQHGRSHDKEPPEVGRTLVVFLGSNIGNFDPPAAADLLQKVRATLAPGDAFLLGADLVKPERDLLLAYDDPLGVTAAFNRNLLVRINRELGADFDLAHFDHRAVWNAEASRIEMHLVSRRRQDVHIPAAGIDVRLDAGESIWTESSYKFDAAGIMRTLTGCGFRQQAQWVDPDAGFALTLVRAADRAG